MVLIVYANLSFLVAIFLLCIMMILFRRFSLRSTSTLKRLDLITRSPIIGHLNATLEGLTTIKAFNAEAMLKTEFDDRQNSYVLTSYAYESCAKAFNFVLEGMSVMFNSGVILRFFCADIKPEAGYVGLAISQAYTFTAVLNLAISKWTELENQMISFERALEYTTIKQENGNKENVEDCIQNGKIVFQKVSFSYSTDDNLVLRNLNFTIASQEKISIIGRTGVGKSSLISILLRLYETEGNVLIDEVNIKNLSKDFIRRKISVVPQEPIIFSDTIRNNLDPYLEHSDGEIWSAIDKVTLKSVITDLDLRAGIDVNLTLGEKQLLYIALAILRNNKILVLDEVTANSDEIMTKLIHQIIDKHFANCTILTITHKLDNLFRYDKIMVLEQGEIVEFDTPNNLTNNTNSKLVEMLQSV